MVLHADKRLKRFIVGSGMVCGEGDMINRMPILRCHLQDEMPRRKQFVDEGNDIAAS